MGRSRSSSVSLSRHRIIASLLPLPCTLPRLEREAMARKGLATELGKQIAEETATEVGGRAVGKGESSDPVNPTLPWGNQIDYSSSSISHDVFFRFSFFTWRSPPPAKRKRKISTRRDETPYFIQVIVYLSSCCLQQLQ